MPEKSVALKLQIKPGHRVWLVNPPRDYVTLLGALPAGATITQETVPAADVVQVFVENRRELEQRLAQILPKLGPKTILWVTYHKGTSPIKTDINRDSIWAYARTIELDAVANVAVNQDWSAVRLKRV